MFKYRVTPIDSSISPSTIEAQSVEFTDGRVTFYAAGREVVASFVNVNFEKLAETKED